MKSNFKPQLKKPKINLSATARVLMIYFTCCIAIFVVLASLTLQIEELVIYFWLATLGSLAIGGLHLWAMQRFFEWDKPVQQQTLFTLAAAVLGVLVFFFSFKNSVTPYPTAWMSVTALAFIIPHFSMTAGQFYDEIPAKLYKGFIIETFEDIDRGSISFEENERGLIWVFDAEEGEDLPREPTRMFAPQQVTTLPFKTLFKASVLFHNVRLNPDVPIEVYQNDAADMTAYEWYFMHRPHSFSSLQYIDPDKTVAQNGLRFTKRKTKYGQYIKAPEIFVTRR